METTEGGNQKDRRSQPERGVYKLNITEWASVSFRVQF